MRTYCWDWCQPIIPLLDVSTHAHAWQMDSRTSRFTIWQNKTRSSEKMVTFHFERTRSDCKSESCYTTGWQKKTNRFSVDGFCSQCNTVFEAVGFFNHFWSRQELRPSLTEEEMKRGCQEKELDEWRWNYIQEKGSTVVEMWEGEWWRLQKKTINDKLHIR